MKPAEYQRKLNIWLDASDSLTLTRWKLCYLMLFCLIMLIPMVVWYGLKEMGPEIIQTIRDIPMVWKRGYH